MKKIIAVFLAPAVLAFANIKLTSPAVAAEESALSTKSKPEGHKPLIGKKKLTANNSPPAEIEKEKKPKKPILGKGKETEFDNEMFLRKFLNPGIEQELMDKKTKSFQELLGYELPSYNTTSLLEKAILTGNFKEEIPQENTNTTQQEQSTGGKKKKTRNPLKKVLSPKTPSVHPPMTHRVAKPRIPRITAAKEMVKPRKIVKGNAPASSTDETLEKILQHIEKIEKKVDLLEKAHADSVAQSAQKEVAAAGSGFKLPQPKKRISPPSRRSQLLSKFSADSE